MDFFCNSLPKVELHANLNESLSAEILKKLGYEETSIREYVRLQNKKIKSFDEYLELCKIIHNATNTSEAVYIATKGVIDEFADECVIYLELRTTPRSEETMTNEEYVESIVKAIKENDRDIIVKLILSINRSFCDTESRKSFDIILKMKKKYPNIIKGIDFTGYQCLRRFERDMLEVAREDGLFITVHIGWLKDEEIKEVLNFRPDRISHGALLHPKYGGSQENWELYCEKKIPVEFCVTSNLTCTDLDLENHHIREWIHSDHPFSICSDGKGLFNITLTGEYETIAKTFKLSVEDLWEISLNAIDYSFASNAEKLLLKAKLAKFKWNFDYLLILVFCIFVYVLLLVFFNGEVNSIQLF